MDMNANGVLGSLNFPSLPGFAGRLFGAMEDKDTAKVLAQAYNDWHIDEWCGSAPGRFIPLAIPMIWDPHALADEIHRVAKKGCHAVTFPENPEPLGLPSLHSDHWDPFWKACSDEGTIVCMHIGSSGKLVMTAPDAPIDVMIVLQPMNIVQCAADLIHSPVFRKFPDVTVALSEGGIGWIPYFLERLDHSYTVHKAWTGADFGSKLPSEVFMEHVVLCYISDVAGVKMARDIGVDRITVEIDYPHSDANWPKAPETLMEEFSASDLTDAEINAMTHENAMRFFRYDPFAFRPRERSHGRCTAFGGDRLGRRAARAQRCGQRRSRAAGDPGRLHAHRVTDPPDEQSEPPEPAESRPRQLPRRPPHPLGMHALVDSCIAFLVIVIPLLFFQLDLGDNRASSGCCSAPPHHRSPGATRPRPWPSGPKPDAP